MLIDFRQFGGEIPRVDPLDLPANNAEQSTNQDLRYNDFRALKTGVSVSAQYKVGTIQTIYLYNSIVGGKANGRVSSISVVDANTLLITTLGAHGLSGGMYVGFDDIDDFVQAVYGDFVGIDGPEHLIDTTGTAVNEFKITVTGHNVTDTVNGINGYWAKTNGFWAHWAADVDVARSPTRDNANADLFYTGDGWPKETDLNMFSNGVGREFPLDYTRLGVRQPSGAMSISAETYSATNITGATQAAPCVLTITAHGYSDEDYVLIEAVGGMTTLNNNTYEVQVVDANNIALVGSDTSSDSAYTSGGTATQTWPSNIIEARSYVYTLVTEKGREGPPSLATSIVEVGPGQEVTLGSIETTFNTPYETVDKKRIYRTATINNRTAFFFVTELDTADSGYVDTRLTSELGEELQSEGWIEPPDDLAGLLALPNGSLAGFTENTVMFSVPYQPHAWPINYTFPTEYPVVGLGHFGTTVVVCTQKQAYVIEGVDPSSATMRAIGTTNGCLGKRTIVNAGKYGVYYASPDGLVSVGPNGESIVTKPFFSREEWQAENPENWVSCIKDGRYIGVGPNGGIMIDLDAPNGGITRLSDSVTAVYNDPVDDDLYFMIGTEIVRWEVKAAPATWKSKKEYLPYPVIFNSAKVESNDYTDLTLTVHYGDGTNSGPIDIVDDKPFRLAQKRTSSIQLELTGNNTRRLAVASSMTKLRDS